MLGELEAQDLESKAEFVILAPHLANLQHCKLPIAFCLSTLLSKVRLPTR